jgi:hypothetical protein
MAVGSMLFLCTAFLALAWARAEAAERKGSCIPDGTMRVVVELKPGPGQTLAGVKVNLDYPEEAVKIPGSADQPEVKRRINGTPAGFLFSPNDLDDNLIVALVGTSGLPAGQIFTVDFDRCKDARKPIAKDFQCKIEEASTDRGVLVDGATCTVNLTSDEVAKKKEGSL